MPPLRCRYKNYISLLATHAQDIKENPMKTLNKIYDITELFLDPRDKLTMAEMANLSRLNKSTVCRMASTMVNATALNNRGRGVHSLGTTYLHFSQVIKNGLRVRDVAFPHLVELQNKLIESTILAPWDKNEEVLKSR